MFSYIKDHKLGKTYAISIHEVHISLGDFIPQIEMAKIFSVMKFCSRWLLRKFVVLD